MEEEWFVGSDLKGNYITRLFTVFDFRDEWPAQQMAVVQAESEQRSARRPP